MTDLMKPLREATRTPEWEGRLWLVGGVVRDALLQGQTTLHLDRDATADIDIMVEGDALAVAQLAWDRGVSSIPPVVYPRFGTAMIRVQSTTIELASARRESYAEDSRKPEVVPATRYEDAQRRDFTVNTLQINLHTGEPSDPLGTGQADLRDRILRTPLAPEATFFDDPLRMLRAVRFRWRLDLTPAPNLYPAIRATAARLAIISAERIRDELSKILLGPSPDLALDDLMQLGLMPYVIPELVDAVGVEQGSFHHLDVWDHTRLVVRNTPPCDLRLRLAALLHDVAKPMTRFIDEHGNTRFFGHEGEGETLTRTILRRLHFANDEVEGVARLVRNHMRIGSSPGFSPAAARRLLRDLGEETDRLLQLVEADASALRPGVRRLDLAPIRERLAQVAQFTPRETLRSPLTGQDVMECLQIAPGPAVGQAQRYLEELVLEGELDPADGDGARARLRDWAPG